MQKILEVKGTDWMKGMSLQTGAPVGGLFQTATGFDPFERAGYLQPSLSPTELTAPVTNPIRIITPTNISGASVVLAHSNSKLYKYLATSPFTQTDLTTSVNVTANVVGAIMWKGKYIYAHPTDLRSWNLNATDVQILANSATYSTLDVRKLCIGADKNLYVADGDGVGKCIINTGTAGNALNAFLIDSDHVTRDLINDGRYLAILADTNAVVTTDRTVGTFSCRIYFWDMSKTTADVIWDFPGESYLIGAAYLDGVIYVFGYNGIYACNFSTPPKLIWDFRNNSSIVNRPSNPYHITVGSNSVYWAHSGLNGKLIYAYGSLPGSSNKIFYSPYETHSTTAGHTALSYSAGTLFVGTDVPKFYTHNTGSTRGNASVRTVPIQLDQPYRFGFAKVTLRTKLQSGQEVNFTATTDGDEVVVSDVETRSFALHGAKKTFKFDLKPSSGSRSTFEDLSFRINPVGGAVVQRVAIYAEPLNDATQND